jgi:hypothetical protein
MEDVRTLDAFVAAYVVLIYKIQLRDHINR